jgi:hypothetical protein
MDQQTSLADRAQQENRMSAVEESFSEALMFHRTCITSKAIFYYKKVLASEPGLGKLRLMKLPRRSLAN